MTGYTFFNRRFQSGRNDTFIIFGLQQSRTGLAYVFKSLFKSQHDKLLKISRKYFTALSKF